MIASDTVVVASANQVACELGGEVAVLNVSTGMYYGLDPVGGFIWKQLQTPRPVAAIRDAITGEYHVEGGRCEQDLIEFLGRLQAAGIVEAVTAGAAAGE
jgi:hypothetical protein